MSEQGPQEPVSKLIHAEKYRQRGETFREGVSRVANTLADDPNHFYKLRDILLDQAFLPAGRVQAAIGSPRKTTAFNCFLSDTINDSLASIMKRAGQAAQTMRLGGGIGYDFSNIRPRGDIIVSLDSKASGPVSFMQIYDAVCKTVKSSGHRRGAQMAVLRVDHPDIEEFIEAKTNDYNLTQFNVSVGVTDDFMRAVVADRDFDLVFEGRVYNRVSATYLFNKIMRATWDWAEPGILFLDRINEMNNLWYCETIAATNPCGEQPLPPNGACLLGSFNLVKYLRETNSAIIFKKGRVPTEKESCLPYIFDWEKFEEDIPVIVRAMDNIIDRTTYPLSTQETEAKQKRRMGLGVTGLANTGEAMGLVYGSPEFIKFETRVLRTFSNAAYQSSALLAKEKGAFPFHGLDYLNGKFIQRLSKETQALIEEHGTRNSHLLSIAPTGTISLAADNVSSGIEPVFSYEYERTIQTDSGEEVHTVTDYGYREFGIKGKTADECTPDEHLGVLLAAQKWVDSACSKTLNVGDDVVWEDFKEIYIKAWRGGAKGCTTFRAAGQRYGILNKVTPSEEEAACYIDQKTGQPECS